MATSVVINTVSQDGSHVSRTLTELHKKTGISLSHLSQVFAGKKELSLSSARTVAFALGVTLDKLDEIVREKVLLKRGATLPPAA